MALMSNPSDVPDEGRQRLSYYHTTMKKIAQVVRRTMQKRTSRRVKRSKKIGGPLKPFAKSPHQHNQDEPVKPELQPVLTTPSGFERLIDYRPGLLSTIKA
jgi:hypothetical protein